MAGFFMAQGQPAPQSDYTNSKEMYPQFQTCILQNLTLLPS